MSIRSIALPRGKDLLWITVGAFLDPCLARCRDEVVESIDAAQTGYAILTVSLGDCRTRNYSVMPRAVRQIELGSGEIIRQTVAA